MELNDFVSKFAQQFDETDSSLINASVNFKELDEWSSMMALSIIAMIDADYDVQLKGTDIRDNDTIEDLFNTIKKYKE